MSNFTQGFFTRTELRAPAAARPAKDSGLSVERLHELGLAGVRDMNPKAKTKHMRPIGAKHPNLYILGESPTVEDDDRGEPFTGAQGRKLWENFEWEDEDGLIARHRGRKIAIRADNICRTLPPRNAKGVPVPTPHHVECYRPTIEESIAKAKPVAVLALGDAAANWCLGLEKNMAISVLRGRRFPAQFGDHVCWVYVAHHPHYIVRLLASDKYEQIPAAEHDKYFAKDIQNLLDDLADGLPVPQVEDEKKLWDGVIYETKDVGRIANFLAKCQLNDLRATIDLETNRKRPYEDGAKILTIAISEGNETIAFPYQHPQATWTPKEFENLKGTLRNFLNSKLPKEGHNLGFDLEWLVHEWGVGISFASTWHCTQAMAHILDERKGGKSVDYLMRQYLGIRLKIQSTGGTARKLFGADVETVSEIDRSRLEQTSLMDVLRYNGLDAKYQYKIGQAQRRRLKDERLWDTYLQFIRRIPCAVLAQVKGLPVDQAKVKKHRRKLEKQMTEALEPIAKQKVVKEFEAKHGKYNWASVPQNVIIFRDLLKRKEGNRGKGYSTDESALSEMKDVPLAGMILAARGIQKLKGTYVDNMLIGAEGGMVYPDGRIHALFKYTSTDTNRLSAADPNVQNQPAREHPWIREQIVPGLDPDEEMVFLASDYGAQEYRGIGMLSHDKVIVDSCSTGYDVHMDWAKRIIKVWPQTFEQRHGKKDPEKAIKAFRSEVKNQLVFPAFYGSQMGAIARNLDMPERVFRPIFDDFWDMFAGVRTWQQEQVKFYNKYGYVESPTGFRRRGPLSTDMIYNNPVQMLAGDMTSEAWYRICKRAVETKREWLIPFLQVHDDLSGGVPKSKVPEALEVIVPAMCNLHERFDWITVPIVVEVKIGPSWGKLEKYGEYRSDKLPKTYERRE